MSDYLKEVQDIQLYILKELIELFEKKGIQYVAVGGTALGAYRHKGFIPWDDDIDIALPRKDYEQFLTLQKELPDDLFIQHFKTDPEYLLYYSKVRKNKTIFLEERDQNQRMHHGVSLDVFPFDNVEVNSGRAGIYKKLQRRFARVNKNREGIVGKIKSIFYRAIYPDVNSCFEKIDKFAQKLNKESGSVLGPPHSDWYMKQDEIFPLREIDFEDIKISVPNKIETYLERKYGDYMAIPEEKDRIAHKPIKVQL